MPLKSNRWVGAAIPEPEAVLEAAGRHVRLAGRMAELRHGAALREVLEAVGLEAVRVRRIGAAAPGAASQAWSVWSPDGDATRSDVTRPGGNSPRSPSSWRCSTWQPGDGAYPSRRDPRSSAGGGSSLCAAGSSAGQRSLPCWCQALGIRDRPRASSSAPRGWLPSRGRRPGNLPDARRGSMAPRRESGLQDRDARVVAGGRLHRRNAGSGVHPLSAPAPRARPRRLIPE